MIYDYKTIEKKWLHYWEQNNTFFTDIGDFTKPKYYVLDMFPYPSGTGLHAGHVEGYTATDIVARMKRMQGYNVLHPMGYDSFGLPAEQFAIKTGKHPDGFTQSNISTFRHQLKMCGFSYDWSKELSTSDPEYYKWTQWIFQRLYNSGLAECVDMPVNWCDELGTVLANDEIIDGRSEIGGHPVTRKNMRQWVIKIQQYADKLLDGLAIVDWPESTKEMQRNWIGKSEGAIIDFAVADSGHHFSVYTTRCDTLFGATYCVLSPEHELIPSITTAPQSGAVEKYRAECAAKSDLERTSTSRDKTGVFTGAFAIHPVTKARLPIYISDYVLLSYGTGAIMAVPAHDERDYAFASKFSLPIIPVILGGEVADGAYTGDGLHINSGFLDGLTQPQAITAMMQWLIADKSGHKKTNYHLRDWIFARQRYWGEPIPMAHLASGECVCLREDQLPLLLPVLDDYAPSKTGASPLERATQWVNTLVDGHPAKLESSTMPGSAGSSWYYLRYIDPHNDTAIARPELLQHWLPVDLYMGGPEHAVGHLLYARMWNRFLYDQGISPVQEPFAKLVHQGMILGANGIKMGKRFPEYAVDPLTIIDDFGADALRLYEMFMGPIEASKPWSDTGILGAKKFLDRVWRIFTEEEKLSNIPNDALKRVYNETIKKVTSDYEALAFNTAISQMMIFINEVSKQDTLPRQYARDFILLLSPIAPFICEELWQTVLGQDKTLAYEPWPTHDESALVSDTIAMPVQINGRLRGVVDMPADCDSDSVLAAATNIPEVASALTGAVIKKIIFVRGRVFNIVL